MCAIFQDKAATVLRRAVASRGCLLACGSFNDRIRDLIQTSLGPPVAPLLLTIIALIPSAPSSGTLQVTSAVLRLSVVRFRVGFRKPEKRPFAGAGPLGFSVLRSEFRGAPPPLAFAGASADELAFCFEFCFFLVFFLPTHLMSPALKEGNRASAQRLAD